MAVDRECIFYVVFSLCVCLIIFDMFGARETFKKLPGGHSSVLTEYEPEASHGDPIQANFR